jgi:hypothetical protein
LYEARVCEVVLYAPIGWAAARAMPTDATAISAKTVIDKTILVFCILFFHLTNILGLDWFDGLVIRF